MGKKRKAGPAWRTLLEALGLSLGLYVAGILLLSLLLVRSILGEGQVLPVLTAVCGLAALAGGVYAVRRAPALGAFTAGALTALCYAGVLAILGLGIWGKLAIPGEGLCPLLSAIVGGLFGGLLGRRKGGHRVQRRKTTPRPAARKE